VEAQEIDATLDELENRLDRLRSLYEQYFLGIEKIEPQVARKDVDRRFWMLRKTVIRNTARRFRLQVLIQRYNTFQQHWTRICREIENGTYVRHLLKVKKNFGEPKTWAARKRLGLLRKNAGEEGAGPSEESNAAVDPDDTASDLAGMLTGGDLDAEVLAATAAAFESAEKSKPVRAGAQQRFSLDDLGPLNLDFDDDAQPALPPKAPAAAAALPRPAAPSSPTTRVAGPAKIPTFPPPVPIGEVKPPGLPQKPPLPRPAAAGARPPLPARPPIPGAPRLPAGLAAPAPAPEKAAPAEPFPPAPSSPSSAPPPRPRLPLPGARPPLPGAPAAAANGARPRLPLPGKPAVPVAARAVPPAAAAPTGTGVVPLPRPAVVTGGPPRAPEPRPNPAAAAPRPPPATAAKDLTDDRLKQLHRELIETKKKLNLESNLSLETLSKSLRDTERKLRAEHQGRSVDFQVVVKDGKAVVKPIVRK
jgi:hypothetical protein